MGKWLQYRGRYLDILLEMEGRPSASNCSNCSTRLGDIKCSNCFGANLFCKPCCLEVHKRSPFHHLLCWNGKHYAPASLYSLGFLLCLGHEGEPCPKTVEVWSYGMLVQLLVLIFILGSEGLKEASGQAYHFIIASIGSGGRWHSGGHCGHYPPTSNTKGNTTARGY